MFTILFLIGIRLNKNMIGDMDSVSYLTGFFIAAFIDMMLIGICLL